MNPILQTEILAIFSGIEDNRQHNILHPLPEVLFLVLCGIMSDCESLESINDFGNDKIEWLRNYLPYKNGIASPDTIARVLGRLSPEDMAACIQSWAKKYFSPKKDCLLQIDGKSLCGTANNKEKQTKLEEGGKRANHLLHLWCSEMGLCLSQQEVPSKSHESKNVEKLLSNLDITGCTVSMDAIFCQKNISQIISSKQANYVLCVKKNSREVHDCLVQLFEEKEQNGSVLSKKQEKTEGSRIEERTYTVLPIETKAKLWQGWENVNTLVKCDRYRKTAFQEEKQTVYYITSLQSDVDKISQSIREHWRIENSLHWQLDISFGEDSSTLRQEKAAINLSAIRKMVLNLFNLAPFKGKLSILRMRKKCLMNDNFRAQCLDFWNNTTF